VVSQAAPRRDHCGLARPQRATGRAVTRYPERRRRKPSSDVFAPGSSSWPGHHLLAGTVRFTCSMCRPHPAHVVLPHLRHRTAWHTVCLPSGCLTVAGAAPLRTAPAFAGYTRRGTCPVRAYHGPGRLVAGLLSAMPGAGPADRHGLPGASRRAGELRPAAGCRRGRDRGEPAPEAASDRHPGSHVPPHRLRGRIRGRIRGGIRGAGGGGVHRKVAAVRVGGPPRPGRPRAHRRARACPVRLGASAG
jgi:hypothetical protein